MNQVKKPLGSSEHLCSDQNKDTQLLAESCLLGKPSLPHQLKISEQIQPALLVMLAAELVQEAAYCVASKTESDRVIQLFLLSANLEEEAKKFTDYIRDKSIVEQGDLASAFSSFENR